MARSFFMKFSVKFSNIPQTEIPHTALATFHGFTEAGVQLTAMIISWASHAQWANVAWEGDCFYLFPQA